tara:strand:+ start:882 stop:1199 length:318 start_codon:yes stop_codon:yes gene_type:complete
MATIPCMACTLPVLKKNNETMDSGSHIPSEEKFMNDNLMEVYYVSDEISVDKNYRLITKIDLHPPRISEPYRKFRKVPKSNRLERKYHNIHQPGRTNCTQRYQGK